MTELKSLYKCNVCGNVVEIVNPGAPALVCCHQDMVKLEAKSVDAGKEKHLPVVEGTELGIKVTVGSVDHPMEEKHFISFIEVITKNQVLRSELLPGQSPHAEFPVKQQDVIEVREYCTLHGLWATK